MDTITIFVIVIATSILAVSICLVLFCNCVKRFKNREKSDNSEQNGEIRFYRGGAYQMNVDFQSGQQLFDLDDSLPPPLPQRYPGEHLPPFGYLSTTTGQSEQPLLWDYGQIDGPGALQNIRLQSASDAPIT